MNNNKVGPSDTSSNILLDNFQEDTSKKDDQENNQLIKDQSLELTPMNQESNNPKDDSATEPAQTIV